MTKKDNDLMERYVYEVTRRIPRDQRDEIGMELQELIGDLMEEEGMGMEAALTKLGNPADFAKRYQDDKNYVISPEYFDNYAWVMKIVLASVGLSVIISSIVVGITEFTAPTNTWIDWFVNVLIKLITNLIISGMGAFGTVTLIFAILERQKVKLDLKLEKDWSVDKLSENSAYDKKIWTPGRLSPVPDKRTLISRGDSVAGIAFIVLFTSLLIFIPQLFGAFVFENGKYVRSIPVFNLDKWHVILPVFVIGMFVCLVDEMVRLVMGRHCVLVMVTSIVTGSIGLVLSYVTLKVLPLWNANFIAGVTEQYQWKSLSKSGLLSNFGTDFFSNIILTVILFATLLEIGVTVYKTLRYGIDRLK